MKIKYFLNKKIRRWVFVLLIILLPILFIYSFINRSLEFSYFDIVESNDPSIFLGDTKVLAEKTEMPYEETLKQVVSKKLNTATRITDSLGIKDIIKYDIIYISNELPLDSVSIKIPEDPPSFAECGKAKIVLGSLSLYEIQDTITNIRNEEPCTYYMRTKHTLYDTFIVTDFLVDTTGGIVLSNFDNKQTLKSFQPKLDKLSKILILIFSSFFWLTLLLILLQIIKLIKEVIFAIL